MHKWTQEDHEVVKILTAEGLTVAQIAQETGLSPGGIRRSRAINRLIATNTTQQAGASGSELLQLRQELETLRQELETLRQEHAELREQLVPLQKEWERARLRRLEEQERENPGGFKFQRP